MESYSVRKSYIVSPTAGKYVLVEATSAKKAAETYVRRHPVEKPVTILVWRGDQDTDDEPPIFYWTIQ
jgi:hypothetical protein